MWLNIRKSWHTKILRSNFNCIYYNFDVYIYIYWSVVHFFILKFDERSKSIKVVSYSRQIQPRSTKNEWEDDAICRLPYWHIINERRYEHVNHFITSPMSLYSKIIYSQCQITNVREAICFSKANDIFCKSIIMKVWIIFQQTFCLVKFKYLQAIIKKSLSLEYILTFKYVQRRKMISDHLRYTSLSAKRQNLVKVNVIFDDMSFFSWLFGVDEGYIKLMCNYSKSNFCLKNHAYKDYFLYKY